MIYEPPIALLEDLDTRVKVEIDSQVDETCYWLGSRVVEKVWRELTFLLTDNLKRPILSASGDRTSPEEEERT